MGIRTKIYCGHDFSEEEGRLRLVIKTCKNANVAVPQEVQERLVKISDGFNQIPIKAELETNSDRQRRFRIKVSDIKNTSADFIYFEFEKFKVDSLEQDDTKKILNLQDIRLDPISEPGPIAKFFNRNEEPDFEYL